VTSRERGGFRVLGCWAARARAGRGRCLLTLLGRGREQRCLRAKRLRRCLCFCVGRLPASGERPGAASHLLLCAQHCCCCRRRRCSLRCAALPTATRW
jgi:hypothetical protein